MSVINELCYNIRPTIIINFISVRVKVNNIKERFDLIMTLICEFVHLFTLEYQNLFSLNIHRSNL